MRENTAGTDELVPLEALLSVLDHIDGVAEIFVREDAHAKILVSLCTLDRRYFFDYGHELGIVAKEFGLLPRRKLYSMFAAKNSPRSAHNENN